MGTIKKGVHWSDCRVGSIACVVLHGVTKQDVAKLDHTAGAEQLKAGAVKAAYRFFLITVGAALMLEAPTSLVDPWNEIGRRFHYDMSNWTSIHIIFSVLEVCLALVAVLWLLNRKPLKHSERKRRSTLLLPLAAFGGLLVLGVANGLLQGGADFTTALWEVRGFGMLFLVYFLTVQLVRDESAVNQVVWVILIASSVLAVENTLRWLVILNRNVTDDLTYDHIDSLVLVFALFLCLGLIVFGGTRWQRRYAWALLPVLLFSMEVMKRRAAFAILPVGAAAFILFFIRLRPQLFWRVGPPVLLLCGIYLAVFWNQTSTLAQPARAISSLISPDPRDAASNAYRITEKIDLQLNIQASPILGLGFGAPYTFYWPLPDLSQVWPFWHYLTHNAILWVWMKGGALCFITFWWLLGRVAYDGARAVETQREEWSIVAALQSMLAGQGRRRRTSKFEKWLTQYANALLRPAADRRRRKRTLPQDDLGLNVPTWDRTDKHRSVTARRSGVLAFIVACVCLVPVQVAYSYVDLGLNSERDMLLLGLAIGIVAYAKPILGVQTAIGKRKLAQATRPVVVRKKAREVVLTQEETVQRVRELVRGRGGKPALARAQSPSQPLHGIEPLFEQSPHETARTTRKPTRHDISRNLPVARGQVEAPLPWES